MKRVLVVLLASLFLTLTLAAEEKESEKRVIRVGEVSMAKATSPGAVQIRFESVSFDPLEATVDYSSLGISQTPSNDYAIVQFDPEAPGARERLQAAGAELVGYLPDHAFRVRMTDVSRRAIANADGVRWVGPYLPGYKIHSSLWTGSDDRANELVIALFPSEDPSAIARKLESIAPAAFTLRTTDDPWSPRIIVVAPLSDRDAIVKAAAGIEGVSWIEPWREIRLHNNDVLGPVQGGVSGAEGQTIFGRGLTGTGQIVGVADSGADIDMCFFTNLNGREAVTPASETIAPEMGSYFPDNKVVGYWVQEFGDAYDDNEECGDSPPTGFHGTHVSGSVLGDNPASPSSATSPGIDRGDGMAPNAQLLFQDIGSAEGCLVVGDGLGLMLEQAYRGGARLHNNSWGSDSNGGYTLLDAEADRFLFDNADMAIFVAAGNSGPIPSSVGTPAVSKNVVSVGALGTGNSTTIARFSGRGPTTDGRVKPDIVAPGSSIVSAAGDATSGNGNCATRSSSGTSMASPITTGAAALLRQYFSDGFYPTGSRNQPDEFEPSGTLVKGALLNGTLPLPAAGAFGESVYGWGRIFLDSNLYFDGDGRDLRVFDLPNSQGMKTGASHQYQVTVEDGEELRVTLVWFDPEATLGSAKALVNDLDLSVSNGQESWLGNQFSTSGESVTGGARDSINNTEQVRLAQPAAGTYTVTVKGTNIPGNGRSTTDRQGYALVISSATCETGVQAAPSNLSATSNPIFGIDLTWSAAPGSSTTQVYRAIAGTDDFRYIGSSAGVSFTDDRAQGGITYEYRVRGADGCGEGPVSASLAILATGACDLQPRFFGITRVTPNSPDCQITLEWAPATAGCTLGDGVNYNIYRSTDRDTFPSTPIATVANVTRFVDITVESGVQYYYIVRAEERVSGGNGPNGGNEETNSVVRSGVVVGPPGDLGTWIDDAGDTISLMVGDFPWREAQNQAQSGNHSYHAGVLGGDYTPDTCASLVTPALRLGNDATLSYWARYDLEWEWDGVVVEISTDGNNWTSLAPDAGYPGTLAQTQNPPVNACGYPSSQGAFTGPINNGSLNEWTEYKSDLSAFAGEDVTIRWRLTTDPGLEFEGFYLDTISITNVSLPGSCIPVIINPEAAFSIAERSPLSGTAVSFVDESEGNPQSWSWSFGDGTGSSEQNPSHVYAEPGLYEVSLTVSNASGSDTLTRSVRIFDSASSYQALMIVPGQARAEGNAGSFFRSAFWLTNLASTESVVRLHYLPAGGVFGGAAQTVLLAIEPGESIAYSDVLTEALGANANTGGVIVVEVGDGGPAPIVTARTYNEPSAFSGSFGQYIPAVDLMRSSGLSLQIDGLSDDSGSRSNVGVTNLSASPISATITVLDPAGSPVGNQIPLQLPPFSASQVNAAIGAQAGSLELFSVRIDGTGPFFAYASKLDNKTSDPIFVPDSLRPLSEQWIDGVGATPGSGGTFFRSNLAIANRGAEAADVSIEYLPRGATSPVAQTSITIPAAQTRFFSDALTEIFQLSGAGMFRIATDPSTPVVAWARTYNDRGALGTLGQFIPGFGSADLIPTNGGLLQGLSDDADYRTNLGLVNVSGNQAGVTIEVWKREGTKAGEQVQVLAAGQTAFIGNALRTIGGSDITDGYIVIRPSTGNAIYAWASYVDNRSTDQTFVRPLPIP